MAELTTENPKSHSLSDVLFERPTRSFASVAAMPSNIQAIEASLMFSTGYSPFVALVGPTGWGKSHLMEAVAARREIETGNGIERMTAMEYLNGNVRENLPVLLLDDVQEALTKTRSKMLLRLALERRVKARRETMLAFTMPKVTRGLRSFIPSVHEWSVVAIEEPIADERVLVINHMAVAEGLALSPRLVRALANNLNGSGRSLMGALKRLRLSGTHWLTTSETLRACGVLDPFFRDNGEYDLRLSILRTAESSRTYFPLVNYQELALYTMLRIAGLSESEVARFLGIEPAEAYLRASRFDKECDASQTIRAYVEQFADLVVDTLSND